ncbi:MAG: ABC transporter ATP-binding protein [Actinomycetaceae bacterium]|nr:ABC transporter ATP-binding protein [Actinomycetaceae bacterium]
MLTISDLTKRYRNGRGFGAVSMRIETGEIVGIVGPNGAGKTTFFSILAGITTPQSGTITLATDNETHTDVRIPSEHVGFLPEIPFLQRAFTPLEAVQFDAAMRGEPISKSKAKEHLVAFGAQAYMNRPIRTLSQGQSKRVELACAFLGSPTTLVLDEPLNGLDIQSVINLREKIIAEKEHGTTVLISSHILTFIDEVADRIVFLNDGHIVGEVDPREQEAEAAYRALFLS